MVERFGVSKCRICNGMIQDSTAAWLEHWKANHK